MLADATAPVVRLSRRFHAPPEHVFDAWLDCSRAKGWLFATPDGEMVRCDIDARVGGWYIITERRGDQDVEHAGQYLQIDRPRRLVFTFGLPGISGDMDRISIDINQVHGGCELGLTHELKPAKAAFAARTEQGWSHVLKGLARSLGDG
jgi:uncharacterized protein YndB with AHSA1/START domain